MKNILMLEDMPIVICGMKSVLKDLGWAMYNLDVSKSFKEMNDMLDRKYYKLVVVCLHITKYMQMDDFLNIVKMYSFSNFLVFAEEAIMLPTQKMYEAGIKGVLDKHAPEKDIFEAINAMMDSKIYTATPILFDLLKIVDKPTFNVLTKRELEIAQFLLEGKSNKQIGDMLQLQPSTVSTFKKKILQKMQVANILDLKLIENWGRGNTLN